MASKTASIALWALASLLLVSSCSPLETSYQPDLQIRDTLSFGANQSKQLQVEFWRGASFNHPSFVIWLEDTQGGYLRTLYVTQSVATGIFGHGQLSDSTWSDKPGAAYRPAALPYWFHKKGPIGNDGVVPTAAKPYTDAYSGATPQGSFVGRLGLQDTLPQQVRVLMEINQTWDWNQTWNNTRWPNDRHYQSSAQPSVVYAVQIDTRQPQTEYYLNPIGHGHPSGSDGQLYTDLTSLSTALRIAHKVRVGLR